MLVKFFKKTFLFLLILNFIFSFNVVLAAEKNTGLLPDKENNNTPGAECGSSNCGNYTLNEMVSVLSKYYNRILGMVGSIALIMFVYGGAMFLISSGNSERVTQAKQILVGSVIGLVIIFASFLIIQFVLDAFGVAGSDGEKWATPGWF